MPHNWSGRANIRCITRHPHALPWTYAHIKYCARVLLCTKTGVLSQPTERATPPEQHRIWLICVIRTNIDGINATNPRHRGQTDSFGGIKQLSTDGMYSTLNVLPPRRQPVKKNQAKKMTARISSTYHQTR